MKLLTPAVFLVLLAAVPATAVVTLNQSNQTFGLTGIGPDASGNGQSKMTWGSCVFDGTTTICTLSGTYTGLGAGGTYSFVVSYAGNGPFPLNAITAPGSNLFSAAATGPLSFVITLTQNSGPPLTFYSFANFSFLYTPAATCTGVTTCSVNQVGQTPNATMTGPITGTFDPSPTIRTSSGVISASGYGGSPSIAPATWIEIYGVNLATTLTQVWAATDFNGIQAPQALGGSSVTVAGRSAYVYFVSPGQLNVQVPSDVPTGFQPVVVKTAGGTSVAYSVNVNATQGGLLAVPTTPFLVNGRQNIVALFSNTLTFVLPGGASGISTARAKAGDNLTLYGVGFGPVTPVTPAGQLVQTATKFAADVQIFFGGVPVVINYAGLTPSVVGLAQFNVVVPNIPASDTVPVTFTVDGTPSTQSMVIAIQ